MVRPRPLAIVLVALALLAGALFYAPAGSTRTGEPMLSPTPPVTLAPAPTTPTPTSTVARPRLPKTGFETGLLALIGLGLVVAGTALRGRRGFGTSLLTVVGVGLVVAEAALQPRARPARRRRR